MFVWRRNWGVVSAGSFGMPALNKGGLKLNTVCSWRRKIYLNDRKWSKVQSYEDNVQAGWTEGWVRNEMLAGHKEMGWRDLGNKFHFSTCFLFFSFLFVLSLRIFSLYSHSVNIFTFIQMSIYLHFTFACLLFFCLKTLAEVPQFSHENLWNVHRSLNLVWQLQLMWAGRFYSMKYASSITIKVYCTSYVSKRWRVSKELKLPW